MSASDDAKAAVTIAKGVLDIAKDNPDAQQAGRSLAKSLAIVADTVHTVLLPLAAMNYGAAKAKQYFETRFEADFQGKTDEIPAEYIVAPRASIAAPALQGLAFSYDEAELREMYLSLLATAMDGRDTAKAHPAFVEVIKQLSAEEAEYLSSLLPAVGSFSIAEFRFVRESDGSTRTAARHQVAMKNDDGSPFSPPMMATYIDNWIRLGLVDVTYSEWLAGEDSYLWVETAPRYLALAGEVPEGYSLNHVNGVMVATDFGKLFGAAVGLRRSEAQR